MLGAITALLFAACKHGVSANPATEYVLPDAVKFRTLLGTGGSSSSTATHVTSVPKSDSSDSGSESDTSSSSDTDKVAPEVLLISSDIGSRLNAFLEPCIADMCSVCASAKKRNHPVFSGKRCGSLVVVVDF